MRFRYVSAASLSLALTIMSCMGQPSSVKPGPAPWLLTFEGGSTNTLVMDKRFPSFLQTHVTRKPTKYWVSDRPSSPARDAMDFLHGPPDEVRVTEKRYLTASACVPHDCVDRGLLWVDVTTGVTVFAASVYTSPVPMTNNRAHLWLFANTVMRADTLPPTLVDSLARWTAEANGDKSHTAVVEVTLMEPDGTQVKLTPADVHAWNAGKAVDKP